MSTFSGPSLEQILTYLVKCRNENRDQFRRLEGQLAEFKERLVGIQEHLAHSNSSSWADVYDYSCSGRNKVKGATENCRGRGENETCYFRRGNPIPNDERMNTSEHCRASSLDGGDENIFVDVENTQDSLVLSHTDPVGDMWRGSSMGDRGDGDNFRRLDNLRESSVEEDEDDVQIVEELAVPGNSSGKGIEFSSRPSVLTKLTGQEALGDRKTLYSKNLPTDNNYRNQETESSTSSSSMDAEIGDINAIFDEPTPVQTGPTTRQSARRKQNRCVGTANESIQPPRKILRIAKAPMKNDPEPPTCQSEFFFEEPSLMFPPSSHIKIKQERVAHAIVDGSKPSNSAGPWLCICGHVTDSKCGLLQHVKRKGTEEPKWQCPVETCDNRFLYPFLVRKHVEKEHGDELYKQRGPDDDKLQGCDKCGKFFFQERKYKSHVNEQQCSRRRGERRSSDYRLNGLQNLGSPSLIITL